MFRVIVAGSRTICNQTFVFNHLDRLLVNKQKYDRLQIVSGTARGVDKIGEAFAQARGYECVRFPADWEKYGKRAGYLRNQQMAEYADALVAFWDGKSPGTKHMIEIAKKYHLAVRVVMCTNAK